MKIRVLSTFLVCLLFACSSTETASDTELLDPVGVDGGSEQFQMNADSDSGTAGELKTVVFAYDASTLSAETMAVLDANAEFINANPSVYVQVEGHCDERGGAQYNLALGERRAQSVYDYLVGKGVSADRLSTISYGKEKPVAYGQGESVWSQNRRANFVVTGL